MAIRVHEGPLLQLHPTKAFNSHTDPFISRHVPFVDTRGVEYTCLCGCVRWYTWTASHERCKYSGRIVCVMVGWDSNNATPPEENSFSLRG